MRPAPLPTRSGLQHGSLRRRLAQTTALAALLAAAPALGQTLPDPGDGNVVIPGSAIITKSDDGNTLTVSTLAPRSVINWTSFNVGATVAPDGTVTRQTANFTKAIDPRTGLPVVSGAASVLNRVVGNDGPGTISQSQILGNLISDPDVSVYLLNSQGVLFGETARVNVGSLIASTRDVTDSRTFARFLAGSPLDFTGTSAGAIEVRSGAQLSAVAATRGVLGLIGARIETSGALNATGEIALVAADDTTINFESGSPLAITIRQGTALSNPILATNTLTGSSILLAAATRASAMAALLDVQATLTATSAYATDQGIVLAAGATAATATNVSIRLDPDLDNAAPLSLTLGGLLRSSGAAGSIDIRARSGVNAPPSPAVPATLDADGGVLVRADGGGVALGDVTSRLVSTNANGTDISAGTGAVSVRAVSAGTASASVVASAGTVRLGSMVAGRAAAVSGTAVTAGSVRAQAGALDVTAIAGSITATTLTSAGRLAATATAGDLVVDSASSSGSGSDLVVRAANVLGRTGPETRAALSAGRDLDVVATGAATLGAITAVRGVSLSATAIDAASLGAGTALGATATTGALTVVDTSAGSTATLRAAGRATLSGDATAGTDLLVSGTEVRLGGAAGAEHRAGRTASYTASIGTVARAATTGLTIRADEAGGGTGAVILDANTGIDLPGVGVSTGAPGSTTNTGNVGIRLATASSPLTLGTVDARALLSVDAAHTTFSPLTVGGAVILGATRLVDSLALSTPGTISLGGIAISGAGQTLSVTGTGTGTTITSTGTLAAAAGVSVTAPGAVTLAGVAGSSGAAAIESTGAALGAGTVTAVAVSARARNGLSLASVTATTGVATLTSTTAGIIVTGEAQARGNVTVDAPGTITMPGGVRSTGGTVVFQSTGGPAIGTIAAGPVRAATDLIVARTAGLTFGSATSDTGLVSLAAPGGAVAVTGTTTAATSVAMSGASLALGGPVTASNGPASLTATSGGITAGAPIVASGTLTLDAPGAIGVDNVRSTGGTVVFQSTSIPATGAITARAVRAAADLSASRAGGLTFDSATSDTGTVSLGSASGAVTVTGATTAAMSVAISGTDAVLGSVTAGTTAAVTATSGIAVAGATQAGGNVTFDAPGTIDLGDVRSTGSTVLFRSTAAPATGSVSARDVRAFTDLNAARGAGLTFRDATSDIGAVSLASTGGAVTVTGAVTAATNVTAAANALTLGAVTATAGSVDLLSTTGRIDVAGAITARNVVRVDAAAGAQLGSVSDTGTSASLLRARGGILTVTGPTYVGGALIAEAPGQVTLGPVTSTGGTVRLASTNAAVVAGAVRANGTLTVTAGTAAALGSATSDLAGVELAASGTLEVAGATTAQADIVANSGGPQTFGDVTSRAGTAALASTGGTIGASIVTADGALTVTGPAGVFLGSARSVNAGVTLAAQAGPLTVAGATRGRGDIGIAARGAVTLGGVGAGGAMRIASAEGGAAATTLNAAGAISVAGATGVSLTEAASTGSSVALRSSGGAIAVATVRTASALAADAATALSIGTGAVGADATLAGRDVTLDTFRAGTLQATARGGDLTVTAGEIRGAATLTKTGPTGAISIARLSAAGPTQITSAGAVRADLLQGGVTAVTAAGDVSGRTGGLNATVSSLSVNAGGTATIGAVTTTGAINVAATGAALLTGAIAGGGDLVASGATVTLGSAGQTVAQTALGRVGVTSTSGAITGIGGLTLRSDTGGTGAGDLTLQSVAGITFQPGTLLAGGPDRQSAVRLGAGQGTTIALDVVEARTITSPGAATSLTHTGPVTIARVAARDTVAVTLTGVANPALTVGSAEVRAGDLALDTTGALNTGPVNVAAGATTLAGAGITGGAITTRSLAATARAGAANFSTVDATAGGIAASAATDLRIARGTATGAVSLTSTAGDVTGSAISGGFDPATLASSGGAITVRADATDGARGLVRLASASGAAGVDLAGRTIVAETLTSSAGAVTASTRRDTAAITAQAMTVGRIDAAGPITLTTGNRAAASTAPLALDRATSTGGGIAITTIGGGLAARDGSPRTILSAPAGAIVLDIGGPAVLGSANAAATTIVAASLDISTAAATGGALALSTRSGPLLLGAGTASGAATIDAVGAITAGSISAGSVALNGTAAAMVGTAQTRSGDLRATVAGAFDADTLDSARGIAVDAGSARITGAHARDATLALTARTGPLRLGAGRAATDATLTAPAILVGTLDAGAAATLTAAGDLAAERLTIGTTLDARGSTAAITTLAAGGDARVTGATRVGIGTATTPATLSVIGGAIALTTLTAGALEAAAGAGGIAVDTATVARAAAIRSDAEVRIDTLGAGTATITARTAIVGGRIATAETLGVTAGTDATLTTVQAGGDAALAAGGQLAIGSVVTPAALALSGRRIEVATLDAGVLGAAAGAGGLGLAQARVAGAATIGSDAGVAIGSLDAGSAAITGAAALTADSLATRGALTLAAEAVDIAALAAGSLDANARTGGFELLTGTVTGAARVVSNAGLTFGTLDAGSATLAAAADLFGDRLKTVGAAALSAGRDAALTAVTAGTIDIRATGGLVADQLAARAGLGIAAGSAKVTTTRNTGGATRIATGAGGLILDDVAAGGSLDASTGGALRIGAAAVAGDAVLTAGTADLGAVTSGGAGRIAAQGALTATRLDAGTLIDARAASATVGQATARSGDLSVTATGGDIRLATATASGAVGLTAPGAVAVTGVVGAGTSYRVEAASIALGTAGADARQAGADVALTARTGAITAQGSTTVAGSRAVTLTANGANGAIGFAPDTAITSGSADVALATAGAASLGTVTASAGAIRLGAADAVLTRPMSAQTVALTNVATTGITRLGDQAAGNEAEFGAPAARFDLSNTEAGLISAPTVTIASGARDVVIGAVGLGGSTGSTRFAITAGGRIDMLGRFVAAGSAPMRTIAIGGENAGARTGVIRIAATQGEGGRLLADGAVIELTADRIGAGLDRDFLNAIGYRAIPGLDVETVTQQYVARPTSTLYTPGALGAAPYTDGVLVRSSVLRLTYGRYALFQNTGRPGEQTGVILGTQGAAPAGGGTLRLSTPNSTANTFALFGTIDGISSQATALLGPDRLSIDATVSPVASRINGCIIGSGGGCLNTSIAQPTLNLFDTSRAEIVRTADDLTLPFDPLIGTNNEALYLDTETVVPPADDCEGDKPCPPKP